METQQQKSKDSFSKVKELLIQSNAGQQGERFDIKAFLEELERENQYMNKEEALVRFLYELSKGM